MARGFGATVDPAGLHGLQQALHDSFPAKAENPSRACSRTCLAALRRLREGSCQVPISSNHGCKSIASTLA